MCRFRRIDEMTAVGCCSSTGTHLALQGELNRGEQVDVCSTVIFLLLAAAVLCWLKYPGQRSVGSSTDEESGGVFRTLLEQEPHFQNARAGLGGMPAAQGRYTDAIEQYSLALADKPTFALSY